MAQRTGGRAIFGREDGGYKLVGLVGLYCGNGEGLRDQPELFFREWGGITGKEMG